MDQLIVKILRLGMTMYDWLTLFFLFDTYRTCSGHPPEAEFLAKIKAIKGVSQVETQTITNVQI